MNIESMNLAGLRAEIQEPVRFFAVTLAELLGSNLQSLTVVGSALTGDFVPGRSDINTVVVIAEQRLEVLRALAAMGKTMRKRRLAAPVLMTPVYIERSRDVFGVEWLDFQRTHQSVLGSDPFADLTFGKGDVRLQCEREFKSVLVRMRQGYIRSLNRRVLLWALMQSVVRGLAPYGRAMLWLRDVERPAEAEATLRSVAGQFDVAVDAALEVRRMTGRRAPDAATLDTWFGQLYNLVEGLAEAVDRMEVGS